MSVGILSFGAYVPRLRLQRKAAVAANSWFNPSLAGLAKGERAMANWDEDAITMAVAAARDGLSGFDRSKLGALTFATTTAPFNDRLNAGIVAAALNLDSGTAAQDAMGSQRAATSALLAALRGGSQVAQLVAAAEHRRARAGSPQELQYGDGAAAFVIGAGKPVAEFLGGHSVVRDFVDHYRGANAEFDYNWEERWVREEGWLKIVPEAINGALKSAGIKGEAITHLAMPCLLNGVPKQIAALCGLRPEAIMDNLSAQCGETGAAHGFLLTVAALETSKPGDLIMMVGFGQGADALIFRVTDALLSLAPRLGLKGHLARRREETNYSKFLSFNNLVVQDKGIRAEGDRQTAISSLYRNRDMLTSFIGGKCRVCGTMQFPKSDVCVNPNCNAFDSQDPQPFADMGAKILSWSADWLTFSLEPPAHYGMVQFEEGGRLMADFTDVDQGQVEVGQGMAMVFRIKEFDEQRGFRRYFWKAAPAAKKGA